HTYPSNTPVTLNATPAQGGMFSGWSGACSGTGPCNVTMTQNLSVTATFSGQQDMVMHSFGRSGNDGQNPLANLISDSAGNLCGTTSAGGVYGNGTVFELLPNGTETVLYNFGSGGDGQNPYAGLIFDTAGNLYGTTVNGGTYGGGAAFELSPNGGGGWAESVLYSFGNGSSDGSNPYAGLVFDNSGNLYGTTANGGPNSA